METCSTCGTRNNPDLVARIRACSPNEVLLACANGGSQKFVQIADLHILPITVHFKAKSMATILGTKTVSETQVARLMINAQVNENVTLTLEDGKSFIFSPFKNGLYYFDTNTITTNAQPKSELENYSFFFCKKRQTTNNFFLRRKLKERTCLGKFKKVFFLRCKFF